MAGYRSVLDGSFGEEITSTSNDRVKFATYTRDSYTGLDYAQQRYYASSYGRFNTPDPFGSSAQLNMPLTWNRYSYVGGDPANRKDPTGLCSEDDWWSGCDCNDDPNDPFCSTPCPGGDGFSGGGSPTCAYPGDPGDGGGGYQSSGGGAQTPSCDDILTQDITTFLGVYDGGASPLNTSQNIQTLVADGMKYDVDPRFIVALAVAETQAGTNMNWGPFNAWDIRTHNPNYQGRGKQPPYTSWSQAINGVNSLIAGKLYFGSGLYAASTIYPKYQGPGYQTGLNNLNTALGQMLGNPNNVTDPCVALNNVGTPNQ
jgi:RHS repeat-associated protein